MSSTSRFILKLSLLIIPFIILALIITDGGSGGAIGGGGYDVTGLVYGLALFAFIILWMLWMLIIYFRSKLGTDRKRQLLLLAIGIVAFLIAWLITPRLS